MISFISLNTNHFSLLEKWLNTPHVKMWFGVPNGPPITLAGIKRKLMPRVRQEQAIDCRIIILNDKPIGYIQWYNARNFPREGYDLVELAPYLQAYKKLAALDIYLGEETELNQGVGSRVLKQCLSEYIQKEGFQACFVDPDQRNKRAIRAFEKAGFSSLATLIHSKEGKTLVPMVWVNTDC